MMPGTGLQGSRIVRTVRQCVLAVVCCIPVACGSDNEPLHEPVPMPDPSPVEYPVALWDSNVEGETEVMIHVNEFGDVDSAMVSQTSGFAEFDSAAVNGVRRMRFTPGRRGERRVAMWTRMPVRFSRDSTAAVGAATESGINRDQ